MIASRTTRLRAAALWGLPMVAAGGYWYVRNLIAVGNPIPYVGSIGPISLPAPVRDFHLRPDFAVAHYWHDTGVWRHWFAPGLHESFGTLWPLTLAGMLAVAVFAIWRGREPILRVLGAFVIVTAVAYVLTPLTAAGEQGQPIAFVWNVRYLAPAVAVGLAILPCLPALRATPRRRAAVLAALAVLLAFTVGSLVQWKQGHVKGAVAAGLLVVAFAVLVSVLRSRGVLGPAARRRVRVALAAAALGVAVAAGYGEQDHYLAHRVRGHRRRPRTSPMRCAGRETCATRESPSPVSARCSRSTRSTAPTSRTGCSGWASAARTTPTSGSPTAGNGGGRSTPAATPTS